MGTKLSTSSQGSSVLVGIRGEKGSYFVGVFQAHKQATSQYKDEEGNAKMFDIYEFKLEDTDMKLEKKDGKIYNEVGGVPGMDVALFAPTRLNNALRQAEVGQKIKITYLGLGKATKFGGKPHEYEVEVL